MMSESKVEVLLGRSIASVAKSGATIEAATLDNGLIVAADYWIDATYEGDLLPLASVSHVIGREARDEYDEPLAGQTEATPFAGHDVRVPSNLAGDWFDPAETVRPGDSHPAVQAWCVRLTLTKDPENLVPLPKPDEYCPTLDAMLTAMNGRGGMIRDNGKSITSRYLSWCHIAGGKVDVNSPRGPGLTNFPRMPNEWLTGGLEQRSEISRKYRNLTLQSLWHVRTNENVPPKIREFVSQFGLCRDEYCDTGHWPPRLYVREGRRLKGRRVFTQSDMHVSFPDAGEDTGIAVGRYKMDSKPSRWIRGSDGLIQREGMFHSSLRWFNIPYEIMLPEPREAANLLVPVAASASHVAYAALRMEAHMMAMGAAAGIAVALARTRTKKLHQLSCRDITRQYSIAPTQWHRRLKHREQMQMNKVSAALASAQAMDLKTAGRSPRWYSSWRFVAAIVRWIRVRLRGH
jgi:hypothetical protein